MIIPIIAGLDGERFGAVPLKGPGKATIYEDPSVTMLGYGIHEQDSRPANEFPPHTFQQRDRPLFHRWLILRAQFWGKSGIDVSVSRL